MITYDEMGNVISSDYGDTDIATPSEFVSSQWKDAVLRWQAAVDKLDAQKQEHESLYLAAVAMGQDELDAWQAQQDKVNMIESAIASLRDSLATASSWARSTFGMGSLQSMNALPLIPIAVITGSIAAVGAVTYAIYSYDDQLRKKWDYLNAHPEMTPSQVIDLLGSSGGGGITGVFGETKSLAMWIAIGGAIYMLLPTIMREFNKGRK